MADAAFGNWDLLQQIHEWGGKATFSFNYGNTTWLWDVLSYGLACKHWRAAVNLEKHCVASVHVIIDDKGNRSCQQLISTSISGAVERIISQEEEEDDEVNNNYRRMPLFTKEALMQMKVDELRAICKKYNIKQGKKKEQFANNIVKRSETVHQHQTVIDQICEEIEENSLIDPAPAHDFYRDWFNLVDLADRRWYEVEDHHAHQSWKTKMILAILHFATMNAWVYATKFNYRQWIPWRDYVCGQLMKL